jgi:hypothetical protein
LDRKGHMVEVFENVLSEEHHKELTDVVFGYYFPWHYWRYSSYQFKEPDNIYQLTHPIFEDGRVVCPPYIKPDEAKTVERIVPEITNGINKQKYGEVKVIGVQRIQFNMLIPQPYTEKQLELGIHRDWQNEAEGFKSAIYYLNNSDGDTVVGDEHFTPRENTAILFDSYTNHRATPPTNTKRRIVLNIVFKVL